MEPAPPAPAAADTGFGKLPGVALITILRHVPQRDRLAACARVSTAWAAAAAAASADVVLQAGSAAHKVASFQGWLDEHAQHVVRLDVSATGRAGLRLPAALARLQHLEVSRIQPLPSQQDSNHLPLLPALRSVILEGCSVTAASLARMQRPQLAALELHGVAVFQEAGKRRDERQHHQQQAVAALLLAQPRLSVLRLHDMQLTDAVLAPLSSMRQLQELSIDDDSAGVTPHRVVGLCGHLTSLELSLHDGARLAASPSAQLPPCLVSLSLTSVQLEPAVLGGLTKLEQLELKYCSLLPAEYPADEADPQDVAAGTAALMAALVQLKQLRSVALRSAALVALDEQQLRAFSALTASSQLSSLTLCDDDTQPLPRGALQHMLPPGRVLQELRALGLEWHSDEDEDDDAGFDADAWCVDAADVASISAACPNLERLVLKGVVRAAPEVVASLGRLQRLPLLELSVDDTTGWLTNEAAAALARISGLTQLGIFGAKRLTDVGLQQFTALRQLRRMQAFYCGLSGGVTQSQEGDPFTGELSLSKDGALTVWQQLEARLEGGSADVQRVRAQQALARVAELEQQVKAMDAQLRALRAELRRTRDVGQRSLQLG